MNKNEREILEFVKDLKELKENNSQGYKYVVNFIKSKSSKEGK